MNTNLNNIFITTVTIVQIAYRPNSVRVLEKIFHLSGYSVNKKKFSRVTWVSRFQWQLYCFFGEYT